MKPEEISLTEDFRLYIREHRIEKTAVAVPAVLTDDGAVTLRDAQDVGELLRICDGTLILRRKTRAYSGLPRKERVIYDTETPAAIRWEKASACSYTQLHALSWRDAPGIAAEPYDLLILTDGLDPWSLSLLRRVKAGRTLVWLRCRPSEYLLESDRELFAEIYGHADGIAADTEGIREDFCRLFPALSERCRTMMFPMDGSYYRAQMDAAQTDADRNARSGGGSDDRLSDRSDGRSDARSDDRSSDRSVEENGSGGRTRVVIPCRLQNDNAAAELPKIAAAQRTAHPDWQWQIYTASSGYWRDKLLRDIAVQNAWDCMEIRNLPEEPIACLAGADLVLALPECGEEEVIRAARALGIPVRAYRGENPPAF